jgi:lysophospholipase L1-like esterase
MHKDTELHWKNRSLLRNLVPALLAVWQMAALDAPCQTNDARPFEAEIRAFEAMDKTNPPARDAILFTGSSSIRKWTTLARDFNTHKVINRGFGGSQISDSTYYADRIVFPYQPRKIVFFSGSNDIAAGKTAEQVFDDFKAFVQKVRGALPKVEIDFISITTSPLRWHQVEQVKKANGLISSWISTQDHLTFINVFPATLAEDGHPKPELFLADRLHMNARGYAIWTSIIEPYLK